MPVSLENVSFRQAAPDDAELIHSMIADLARYQESEDDHVSEPDDFNQHLSKDPPSFYGLIAEQDGAPVGLSLFFPSFSSWRGAQGVYVQDLYVSPDCRAGGLGKRLLMEVLRFAHDRWGAVYLRLAVYDSNMTAHGFYERIGMAWAEKERIFQIDGDDLVELRENGKGINEGE